MKKKRFITAVVLFALMLTLGTLGFMQLAENNQIRAAHALIQQAIEETTLALSKQELKFAYDEYNFFVFNFADFLNHVDEELIAHFNEDRIYAELTNINAQLLSFVIDKEAALEDALTILTSGNEYINTVTLHEKWVPNENLIVKDLLGTFYTYFDVGQTGRSANLRRAAELIDNYTIQPNEIFNMTDTIGPINANNGYHMALVIRDGEFVEGMGGGVCQVSSTLYMAALFAELEIVQRRAHSRLVGYMPPAFDAVLSIPTLNLRFRNTTASPITIETIVDLRNGRITTNIWGVDTRPEGRTISFDSVRVNKTSEWLTYHLYKYVDFNGTVTRTRINISGYRVEREDEITYYEAVGGEIEGETACDETASAECEDENTGDESTDSE